MIHGSCLCGAVSYELGAPPHEMMNCHCSKCRKSHGAAFATFARVDASSFRITAGEEVIERYRSTPKVQRCFCSRCGSPIMFLFDPIPEMVWVIAGSFDDDPGITPSEHIFVGSKAPWHEIADDLPQHAEYPVREPSA